MKTSSAQLKLWARRALIGNYGMSIGAQLVIYAITMGVTMVLELVMIFGSVAVIVIDENAAMVYMIVMMIVVYLAMFTLEMMLMPGLNRMYMNICTNKKPKIGDVFFAFKNHPGKFVLITAGISVIAVIIMVPMFVLFAGIGMSSGNIGFMMAFFTIYWILLAVGMMYVNLTYGMFYFILVENPEKGILEALGESRRLMIGNRWRYFCLGLSFLGMILLGYMSLGIGFVWIFPYIICTNMEFYLDIKPAEVYPPDWQNHMQESQWEMRREPSVGAGYMEAGQWTGPMGQQPTVEPGNGGMPGQGPVESGNGRMPGQGPVESGYAQMPVQPDDWNDHSDW